MELQMLMRWTKLFVVIVMMLVVSACTQAVKPRFSPLPLPEFPEQEKTEHFDARYRQAWQMLLGGEPDRALAELKSSRSPEKSVYSGFGFVYLVKKNYPLSEKNFKRALQLAEDDPMALAGLGLLYELTNRNEEAFDLFRTVKKLYPGNPWTEIRYDRLRVILTEDHVKKAETAKNAYNDEEYIRELEKAQYYSPEMTDLSLKLAAQYREMGKPEKAVLAYRQLMKNDPYNPLYLKNLAEIYDAKQEYDNALILYRRLLDLNPNDQLIQEKIKAVEKAFDESAWPKELKGIFFKEQLNREDAAALLGLYFPSVFSNPQRLIISDISSSYAFREIIKVCGSGVMTVRPDHRFDRYGLLDRSQSALILDRLIRLIQDKGRTVDLQPVTDFTPPRDIPPTHRDYQIISGLLSVGLMELDETMQFRPLDPVNPDEFINALKRIELAVHFNDEPETEG